MKYVELSMNVIYMNIFLNTEYVYNYVHIFCHVPIF